MTRPTGRRDVLRLLGGTGVAVLGGELGERVTDQRGDTVPETSGAFSHETVDASPPTRQLGFCGTADLTGNGLDDVVVAGKGGKTNLWLFGRRTSLPTVQRLRWETGIGDWTVVWYENPGWERHVVAQTPHLAEGGVLGDITGNGRVDLVVGQATRYRDLYWFEQPADPRATWTRHRITDDFEMYHDVTFEDIDGDGRPEVVGLSQGSEALFYYDIPADPRRTPWPDENRTTVMEGTYAKGLTVVADDRGPGDVVAGTSIYHREGGDHWRRERFATGFEQPRIGVVDLDGDGDREIVLAEGDSPALGTHPGRLAWFDPPDWEPHVLRDDLFCPHSLLIADFDGNGHPDIVVGEMGLGQNPDPTVSLFRNRGDGRFRERVLSRGVPTHEATTADLTGNGRPDIVGKSYAPETHVDVWYNRLTPDRPRR